MIIVVHVDDPILLNNNEDLMKNTQKLLLKEFEMSNQGFSTFVWGWKLFMTRCLRFYQLINKKYIQEKILHTYKMLVCNLTITPLEAQLKLNKSDSLQSKEKKTKMVNIPYQSVVCNLMHAMVSAWPNITFAINLIAQYYQILETNIDSNNQKKNEIFEKNNRKETNVQF